MSILRLIQSSLQNPLQSPIRGIPATLYNHPIVVQGTDVLRGVDAIVWVGLDVDAVRSLVAGESCEIGSAVTLRLSQMVEAGEIYIDQEYRVTVVASVTGGVVHVVEASSEEAASDKVLEMIRDGEGLEDLLDDYTVDDAEVDHVEEA